MSFVKIVRGYDMFPKMQDIGMRLLRDALSLVCPTSMSAYLGLTSNANIATRQT